MKSRPLPSPLQRSSGFALRPRRWLDRLTWLFLVLALARGVIFVAHDPLVALANNYDQVRYTACFDIYPDRPGVPPTQHNYQAPLEFYSFQIVPDQHCYASSDLLFQGAAVAIFRVSEWLGGGPSHSVRVLGILRLAALLGLGLLTSWLLRRDGRSDFAAANAFWLAALGMDPVNAMLLNSFYAEAGVFFFAYAFIGAIVLTASKPNRARLGWLALTAIGLGTSKIQHLALPLLVATALLIVAFWRERRLFPVALTVLVAAVPVLTFQFVQMRRDDAMTATICIANNTDFALTALLPASAAPEITAQRLGLAPACAALSGKSFYTVGSAPEQACPGIERLSRLRAAALIFQEPATIGAMLARTPQEMLPWIPSYLGLVADQNVAPLPATLPSLSAAIGTRGWLATLLLFLPFLGILVALNRRSGNTESRAFAATCATLALAVPVVSVFGDGYAEIAKHAHLALNAACAYLFAGAVALVSGRGHRQVI